jgi:MraZ protein
MWAIPSSEEMFRGATNLKIDDKGRVVVPARHRTLLTARSEGRLVVTADRDKCLLIYTAPDFEQIEQQLLTMSSLHPRGWELQHMIIGRASEVEIDSHGRIALTPELRAAVGIDRDVTLVGQGRKLELWCEKRWAEQCAVWSKTELSATDMPAEFAGLSL